MNNILKEFEMAKIDLHLDLISPFTLDIPNKGQIHAVLLLKDFGAKNGILIITDFKKVIPVQSELKEMGYAYSTLSEPKSMSKAEFDRETFIEMLSDWGWSGDLSQKPKWIVEIDRNAD